MAQQTAVEWLIEQLTPSISLQQKHIDDLKDKAKQMHKEQIVDAFEIGWKDEDRILFGEEYYNETFGGQGSPDTTTSPTK